MARKMFRSDSSRRCWKRRMSPYPDLSVSTLCSPSSHSLSPGRGIYIDVYDEAILVETELYDTDPKDPAQVLNKPEQKAGAAARSAPSNCVAQFSCLLVWWMARKGYSGDSRGGIHLVVGTRFRGSAVRSGSR